MEIKQKNGSYTNCCVYGCHSRKGRSPELHFHRFPLNNLRRKAWAHKLLMGKPVTKWMKVCSLHFVKEDYIVPGYGSLGKHPVLKKDALPSQNLPLQSFAKIKKVSDERYKRLNKRREKLNRKEQNLPKEHAEYPCEEKERAQPTIEEISVAEALLSLVNHPSNFKKYMDKAIQVKSGQIIIAFTSCIDSDQKLNSLTGLNSFELLNTIEDLVCMHFDDVRSHKLSIKDRIIMLFMKLKLGLSYVVLSCLFGTVTNKTCSVIVQDMILKVEYVLKHMIMWPTLTECWQNMPHCFKEFPNVRVVLDCTEISVQKSKCLCCRINTYSHYKGGHTIKFLTGVSPGGLITFVSAPYGGRAPDKVIFEQSGLINKLEKGKDAIMVDKGFLIHQIAKDNFIKVIQPPFMRNNRFSAEDAELNVKIARARVHVERSNQRIKIFEIFKKPLPWTLVPVIDKIFTIVCAVVNMSSPILSDDKFIN